MPNTVMNQGPLPPNGTKNLPIEFQTPDGLINETNSLLGIDLSSIVFTLWQRIAYPSFKTGNLNPYAYGKNDNRPSTQTSYINHPHRIQKVIPKLFIPSSLPEKMDLKLEHAIHDGDLCFTIRMKRSMLAGNSEFCIAPNIPGKALAPLVNLATVNYILKGLQDPGENRDRWNQFFLHVMEGNVCKKNLKQHKRKHLMKIIAHMEIIEKNDCYS